MKTRAGIEIRNTMKGSEVHEEIPENQIPILARRFALITVGIVIGIGYLGMKFFSCNWTQCGKNFLIYQALGILFIADMWVLSRKKNIFPIILALLVLFCMIMIP